MKFEIKSRKDYHNTMVTIYKLMDKGEKDLSDAEQKKLTVMAAAAEKYEDEVLRLRPGGITDSIAGIVQVKMFEHKMTQAKLASAIGVGQSKVSEILSGKRKPDIPFLKGVHKILKIDAGFLLEHA